jgi:hypothetical protein
MRRAALFAAMALAVASAGCHKSSSTAATPSITISPTDIDLEAGTSEQFGDTIMNESTSAVTWLVNGVAGGTITTGMITANGLYTAPTVPPNPTVVVITVEVTADTATIATASITITPVPVVTLTPSTAPATPGAPTAFSVSLFGLQNCESPAVTWEVGNIVGGNASVGTIVQTMAPVETCVAGGGTYTTTGTANYFPPQVPPPGGEVVVNVYLDADSTQSAGSTVTVNYGAASIVGSYAMSIAGQNMSGGYFARAGQLTFDGVGAITGVEDIHTAGGAASTAVPILSGAYTVGVDGRGTATITDSTGTTHYDLAIVSAAQIKLIEDDTFATAHGQADMQTPLPNGQSNLFGAYAFDFSGVVGAAEATSEVGRLAASGSAGSIGTCGLEDVNAGGTPTQVPNFSCVYSAIDAREHGTLTINGTQTFSFYVISAGQARFIETDASGDVVGDALEQSNGTPSASWLSSLTIFQVSGSDAKGQFATAGLFLADGAGGLPTSISGGLLDENNDGVVSTSVQYGGTYSVASTGRGTASFTPSGQTFVIYFVSPGQGFIQETDSSIVADGVVEAQRGGIFSTLNVTGSFALNWTGAAPSASRASILEQDSTGQLTVGKTASVATGTWDRDDAFTPQPGIALATGSYALAVNGRGTVTLTDANNVTYDLAAYVVNSNTIFLVGTDASLVFAGQVNRQF